tara:strand:+ start:309 stop:530 length:222 start_codon:yes stop_codon:yes gene_type:complete
MTRSQLIKLVREVLSEANTTSGGASFAAGAGENYKTKYAFGNANRAGKISRRHGYKKVSRPKRPSHTKGFDYL